MEWETPIMLGLSQLADLNRWAANVQPIAPAFRQDIILGLGPFGTHDSNSVFSRLLCVLKWGLLFDETRGVITNRHSLAAGE
jgi:hypothetical protein